MRVYPTVGAGRGGTPSTIYGAGFNSSASYTVIFRDSRSGVAVDTPLQIVSPLMATFITVQWPLSNGTAVVDVQEDGAPVDIIGQQLLFSFTYSAWVRTVPSTGPSEGGYSIVVYGSSFQTNSSLYFLEFQDALNESHKATARCNVPNDTTCLCTAPRWTFEATTARIELIHNDFTVGKIGSTANFSFTQAWSYLAGSIGSISGGTVVTIFGAGFQMEGHYTCVFTSSIMPSSLQGGLNVSTNAVAVSPLILICSSPLWPDTEQSVDISLMYGARLVQFIGAADNRIFTYLSYWNHVESIQVQNNTLRLSSSGGDVITVVGQGFGTNFHYFCRFQAASFSAVDTGPAHLINSTFLTCQTRKWTSWLLNTSAEQDTLLLVLRNVSGASPLETIGPQVLAWFTRATWNRTWSGPLWSDEGTVFLNGGGFCHGARPDACSTVFKIQFGEIDAPYRRAYAPGRCSDAVCSDSDDACLEWCRGITATSSASKIINDTVIAFSFPVWSQSGAIMKLRVFDSSSDTDVLIVEYESYFGLQLALCCTFLDPCRAEN